MADSNTDYENSNVLLLHHNPSKFLELLSRYICLGPEKMDEAANLLELCQKYDKTAILKDYRDNGDTLLHKTALFHEEARLLKILLDICPDLLLQARQGELKGQTALHLVISKGNIKAARAILKHKSVQANPTLLQKLLNAKATGTLFAKTVLMGELPLTVAALTLNFKMVKLLLKQGAKLFTQNSQGDTVFHSLIKYAKDNPEKEDDVVEIMLNIHDRLPARPSHDLQGIIESKPQKSPLAIWRLESKEKLTPLRLAASLGQVKIFSTILNLKNVYCFLQNHDGVFDIHLYDITEIDTVSYNRWKQEKKKKAASIRQKQGLTSDKTEADDNVDAKTKQCHLKPSWLCCLCPKRSKAVLEMICSINVKQAFQLINLEVVKVTIKEKWHNYRKFYYGWMCFHLSMMILLSVYAVYKTKIINSKIYISDQQTNSTGTLADRFTYVASDETFVKASGAIGLVYGILYIFLELLRTFYLQQEWHPQLIHHNGFYRFALILFSFSLIVDFAWYLLEVDNNYFLILAILMGWWFCMFFLRTHKKFSFFTVMFQKVLVGDMFRFSTLIVLELLSFSVAMHITFLNTKQEHENFEHLGSTMLTMFKLMLGLTDIEILYSARDPWLAVTLFTLFVLIAYVLLINSLIAMMSQTCSLVSEDRYSQWELQRLSVILHLESMIPPCFRHVPGRHQNSRHYDILRGKEIYEDRFVIAVKSVQTNYVEGKDFLKWKSFMRTQRFEGLSMLVPSSYNMLPHHGTTSTQGIRHTVNHDDSDSDFDDDQEIPHAAFPTKSVHDNGHPAINTQNNIRNTVIHVQPKPQSSPKWDMSMMQTKPLATDGDKQTNMTTGRKRHSSECKSRKTQTETSPLSFSFPSSTLKLKLLQVPNSSDTSDYNNHHFLAVPSNGQSFIPCQLPSAHEQPGLHQIPVPPQNDRDQVFAGSPQVISSHENQVNTVSNGVYANYQQVSSELSVTKTEKSPRPKVQFLDLNELNSEV